MKVILRFLMLAAAATFASAASVPANVQIFLNRTRFGQCTGGKAISSTYYSNQGGSKTFQYCEDNSTGVLYLHGQGSYLANMDIDCDGLQDGGDGRCHGNNQGATAFKDYVQQYSDVSDLNPSYIPYVVFGNECDGDCPSGYQPFDPKQFNVQPLSVMAVVCNGQLVFGVWGDTNGADGPPLIGEASLALATQCFGRNMTDSNGHSQDDVLYIAFPGSVNETVNQHADFAAKSYTAFENSIQDLGSQLVKRLK